MSLWKRVAFFAIVLTAGILSVLHLQEIQSYLKSVAYLIEQHPVIGSICFSLGLGISSMFMFPTTFPTIFAGTVFPFWLAVIVVIAGEQLSIILSFLIGKSLFREWIHSLVSRDARTRAIDRAVGEEGIKLVFLLRLTPIFPFGLCNYILAATRIKLFTVCLASAAGNLPGCLIYVTVGTMIGTDQEFPFKIKLIMGMITLGFAIGASIFITLFAQKALRGVVDLEPAEELVVEEEVISPDDSDSLLRRSPSQVTDPEAQIPVAERSSDWTPKERRILQYTTASLICYFVIGSVIIAVI